MFSTSHEAFILGERSTNLLDQITFAKIRATNAAIMKSDVA
jgi:hypothetical protein